MFKLAVDLMGSDLGSEELSKGVKEFLSHHDDVELMCYGKKEELEVSLKNVDRTTIVDCREVVPMECSALKLLRMKDSSMVKAIKDLKENGYDGVVSAGSTGGFLTGATIILRNIEGVDRAGLCAPFPTPILGKQAVLLDIGASNENGPEDLVGFAKMGRLYAKCVLNEKNPNVSLLNNGAEEGKGPDYIKEAYKIMKEENFPGFIGNCESRYTLDGKHDVVVASGFAGNVFLKASEGIASMMNGMIKKAFKRNIFSKIGYLLSKPGFDEMKKTMDYKATGGAILLGVNGVVVKAHGNSDAYSFRYALEVAYKMASTKIVDKIKEEFSK